MRGNPPLRRAFAADGCKERRREIPVAAVGQKDHYHTVAQFARFPYRYLHGRATRHTHKDTFLDRKHPGRVEGLFICNYMPFIKAGWIEDLRYDAFSHVFQALADRKSN